MAELQQRSKRVEFIDLLRGWAVLVMIETHVLNATLSPEVLESSLFQWIKFINGLVAPSFLFASGLAYAVTTRRKMNDYLSFGPPLFKQLRRLLFVVMIGYLLHLPKFNVVQIIHESTERSWQVFFQADVLQCIGVSLLLIQGLLLVTRNETRLYNTVLSMTIAIALITPVMWGIDWRQYVPLPVAGYLNGMHFPHFPGFPLFPWTSFLFAGAVFGYFYLKAKDADKPDGGGNSDTVMMVRSLFVAAGIILVAHLTEPLASQVYPVYDYWRFGPSFVFFRIALVVVITVGLFFYEKNMSVSPRSVVTLIGRESLLVYAVHLLLIYGNFGPFNFQESVDHSFGYAEAMAATAVLVLLMYLLAWFWDKMRKRSPLWKRRIEIGVALTLLGVFLFGPGE